MTGAETHDILRHLIDMSELSVFFICATICIRAFFKALMEP